MGQDMGENERDTVLRQPNSNQENNNTKHKKLHTITVACSYVIGILGLGLSVWVTISSNDSFSIDLIRIAFLFAAVAIILLIVVKDAEIYDYIIRLLIIATTIVLAIFTLQKIGEPLIPPINRTPTPTATLTPTLIPPIENPTGKIAAGDDFSLLLKSDKTVATYGAAKGIDTSSWENITQIAAYKDHAIGLREDKTVVVTGVDRKEYNVSDWSDIVQVAACNGAVLGLRENGELEIKGPCTDCLLECDKWGGVNKILGAGELVVAQIRNEGVMVADECMSGSLDYDEYERIVSGAVVNYPGQVEKNWMILLLNNGKTRTFRDGDVIEDEVSYWTDMKQVAGGNGFAIGLNKDGFVFKAGNSSEGDLSGISNWSNMIAVCAGTNHVVGLREDGALLAVGYNKSNQCSIEGKNYWSVN